MLKVLKDKEMLGIINTSLTLKTDQSENSVLALAGEITNQRGAERSKRKIERQTLEQNVQTQLDWSDSGSLRAGRREVRVNPVVAPLKYSHQSVCAVW